MSTVLNYKPWKVWMSSSPTAPTATLLSLYDLLCNDSGLYAVQYNSSDASSAVGANLGHNIIIFKSDLYSTSGGLITSDKALSTWELYGIDLCCPTYDKKCKPYVFKPAESALTVGAKTLDALYPQGFYLFDKEAALWSPNTASFYKGGGASSFRNDPGTANDWTAYSNYFHVGTSETSASYSADIMLSAPDTVFQSSMIFESGKDAFTEISLNITSNIKRFIQTVLLNAAVDTATANQKVLESDLNISNLSEILQNEDWIYVFKHLYVWVKAAFAADYINPADFNQDLNQEADVIHQNIYARINSSDFNRYDEEDSTTSEHKAEKTRGYIPRNAPLKDYVSEDYYTKESTVEETMEKLIAAADIPESTIGGTVSEPVKAGTTMEGILSTNNTQVSPPQFFDPESRNSASSYNRVPAILPKHGNVYADSRIIGPSMDEIWYIVKKIISGRTSDTLDSTVDFAKSASTVSIDGKYSNINPVDTSLKEVNNPFIFKYKDSEGKTSLRKGDPVDFDITYDESTGAATSIAITEFFSQPDTTFYAIYSDNTTDENRINKWANDLYTSLEDTAIEGIDTGTNKSISEAWNPRENPLSLRELEARTLGNKFEIIKNFRFITTNFTVVGGLGYHYEDEEGNTLAAGSLYQMHKDYNFNPENPNTFFRMNGQQNSLYDKDGKINSDSGSDATFSDLQNVSEDEVLMYNSESKKKSKLPLLVENYGKSVYLSEDFGEYSGADIYMAADGTWRYKAEHMRAPILRSRY